MNGSDFGQTKVAGVRRAASAMAYLVEFVVVGAVFFGITKAGLLSLNTLETPLLLPAGFALALYAAPRLLKAMAEWSSSLIAWVYSTMA